MVVVIKFHDTLDLNLILLLFSIAHSIKHLKINFIYLLIEIIYFLYLLMMHMSFFFLYMKVMLDGYQQVLSLILATSLVEKVYVFIEILLLLLKFILKIA